MTAIDRPNLPALPSFGAASQATQIEQSRSVAEVLAAIHVAQAYPRNQADAIAAIRDMCSHREFAEKAFYSYPRAGETVSGESIHLARAVALAWCNVDFGVKELARDDNAGSSEIQAFAWDQQRNVRVTNSFILPHRRDKKTGSVKLTDLRDIYENNANNGARRLRECIFAVIPPHVVTIAATACRATLNEMTEVERAKLAIGVINDFARGGVTEEQLEKKVGRGKREWSPQDITELRILFNSLRNKDITKDEAFPTEAVTAAEILTNQPTVETPSNPGTVTAAAILAAQPAEPETETASEDEALSEPGTPPNFDDEAWLNGSAAPAGDEQ